MSLVGSGVVKMAVINFIIALFVIVCSAILGYWAQDWDDPITDYKAQMVTTQAEQGSMLKVRHSFIRRRKCHVHLEQFVFDGDGVRTIFPDEDYTVSPGQLGEDNFVTAVQLPLTTAIGPARYRAVRSYTCNPLQTLLQLPIIVISPDLKFDVVPRSGGPRPAEVAPLRP
jgi:hypothetical protein